MNTQTHIKYIVAPTDPIAVIAFQEWIAAGKPSGQDEKFWEQAEARLRSQPNERTAQAARAVKSPQPEQLEGQP